MAGLISKFVVKVFSYGTRNSSSFIQSIFRLIRGSKPTEMTEEKIKLVKDFIDSDYVVIFSKSYCPYCTMAKDVFTKIDQKYTVIELDERDDGDAIQAVLGQITGAKTVPRVFIKGHCIGGGTDVKKLYDSGELKNMIE